MIVNTYEEIFLTSSGELKRKKNIKREGSSQKNPIGPKWLLLASLFPIKWNHQIRNPKIFLEHPLTQCCSYHQRYTRKRRIKKQKICVSTPESCRSTGYCAPIAFGCCEFHRGHIRGSRWRKPIIWRSQNFHLIHKDWKSSQKQFLMFFKSIYIYFQR